MDKQGNEKNKLKITASISKRELSMSSLILWNINKAIEGLGHSTDLKVQIINLFKENNTIKEYQWVSMT
ncbi:unnamed protein product [Leptidea sinapis]|uniref:Uncharacterized protein n=1 Tax=Leptidea sinapis TaxID=189913 RepID=A0A5E4QA98_9NEOP|nr:unnamed protein product [Leptidea sinapis]